MTAVSQGPHGVQPTIVEGETGDPQQALAAAKSLADRGRFLAAIDLLNDANRRQRDAEIEARLITLRNAA